MPRTPGAAAQTQQPPEAPSPAPVVVGYDGLMDGLDAVCWALEELPADTPIVVVSALGRERQLPFPFPRPQSSEALRARLEALWMEDAGAVDSELELRIEEGAPADGAHPGGGGARRAADRGRPSQAGASRRPPGQRRARHDRSQRGPGRRRAVGPAQATGTSSTTEVPPCSRLATSSRPPASAARSRIPRMPKPPGRCGRRPEARAVVGDLEPQVAVEPQHRHVDAGRAPACLTTLVSASCVTR